MHQSLVCLLFVILASVILCSTGKATVGSYGTFDSVNGGGTDEATSINFNNAGYFQGEVPRGHHSMDTVSILASFTFTAHRSDYLYIDHNLHVNYHFYIGVGLGHAIIKTILEIKEQESGNAYTQNLFEAGGYHYAGFSGIPPDEGGEDTFRQIYRQTSIQLRTGYTYTVKYLFLVEATEGSYVEQYGSDPYSTLGPFVDFSGYKYSGHLLLKYKNAGEIIKTVGGEHTHRLKVYTYRTPECGGTHVNEIPVWIQLMGDTSWDEYYSPAYIDLLPGWYTVKVEREYWGRSGWKFTFQYWENGYTGLERDVNVINDMSIKAYYKAEYIAGGGPGGPV